MPNDLNILQDLRDLNEDFFDAEKEELDAQHELIDAQAWAVKMKRQRDEALEKLQAFKKKHDL